MIHFAGTLGFGDLASLAGDESLFAATATEKLMRLQAELQPLAERYDVVVANPPYMGSSSLGKWNGKWIKDNFPEAYRDLCTSFIDRGFSLSNNQGYSAMVTMQSWMFLGSYEKLRGKLLRNHTISSMAHLGTRAFDAIGGEVVSTTATVFANKKYDVPGTYLRLVNMGSEQEKAAGALEALANPSCGWIYCCKATDFDSIPGSPIAYWSVSSINEAFKRYRSLAEVCAPKAGLSTADNERFLRFWWEVTNNGIAFDSSNQESMKKKSASCKWFPMTKGGTYRKWFGNNEYILNFENDGEELKYWLVNNPKDPSTTSYSRYIRNYDKYCEAGISFSDVSSGQPHFRRQPSGFIPNARGPYLYTDSMVLLAFLNSSVTRAILEVLAPTLTFNVGDLAKLPIAIKVNPEIEEMAEENIAVAEKDWDAFEVSWHFKKHPLC